MEAASGAAPSAPAEASRARPALADTVSLVGQQYCLPHPIGLTVTRKAFSIGYGNFAVTDVTGAVVLRVRHKLLSLRQSLVLLDGKGTPLLSMQKEIFSLYRCWRVFKVDDTGKKDLLFTLKKPSVIQFKTEMDVFLADSTDEKDCVYKIRGSFLGRSCTFYRRGRGSVSDTIIAQGWFLDHVEGPLMNHLYPVANVLHGKDTFGVMIYPHIDYAFIVALIVILDEIRRERIDDDYYGDNNNGFSGPNYSWSGRTDIDDYNNNNMALSSDYLWSARTGHDYNNNIASSPDYL